MGVFKCPNCGASYNPRKYRCEYCGSYIIRDTGNYVDLSSKEFDLSPKLDNKYPGIYVFGRLLGKGEKPITLGVANYFTGKTAAGGRLLLTDQSISFSAHALNVGRLEAKISLHNITSVNLGANFLISQHILIETTNGEIHKFVVYHGKEWIAKIEAARKDFLKNAIPSFEVSHERVNTSITGDYTIELRKLKVLLNEGIITQEEFDIKKRKLLGI